MIENLNCGANSNMSEDILINGLKKCGIAEEMLADLSSKMERYIKEIILFNSAYNLTNTSEHDELVIRHILDSLAPYEILKRLIDDYKSDRPFLVADIGSGGGLPGIPLAALFPEINFNLVERMEKRCSFLENCAAILGLKNVKVVNLQAEAVPEESYDLITFRAFRPLDKKMMKTLLRIVKKGGLICAYKAKLENIQAEMDGIKALVPEYKVEKLSVPYLDEVERNLVIIKKMY